jgi:hypothetical protein
MRNFGVIDFDDKSEHGFYNDFAMHAGQWPLGAGLKYGIPNARPRTISSTPAMPATMGMRRFTLNGFKRNELLVSAIVRSIGTVPRPKTSMYVAPLIGVAVAAAAAAAT